MKLYIISLYTTPDNSPSEFVSGCAEAKSRFQALLKFVRLIKTERPQIQLFGIEIFDEVEYITGH